MYILKIKGNGKIPDHVQLRDDDFTLVAYFKVGNHAQALKKCGLSAYENEFANFAASIPYGIIKQFTIKTP